MSAQERWERTEPTRRPVAVPSRGEQADPDRSSARILSVIALASIAAGAIHVAAAATIGRDSSQNMAFFVAMATGQLVWGAVALLRAPRWWLALGVAGNVAAMAAWVVSRTVGLPFGVYAHVKLPVGFPDALATALEAVVVVGAATLIARGRAPARAAARSPRVAIAAAVLVGALALGGVMSQAGASGSSGSNGNGGGVSGPYAPGGGGGSSGGGSGGSGGSSGYGY